MRIVFFFLFIYNFSFGEKLTSVSKEVKLMGSSFTFTAVSEDIEQAEKVIELSIDEVTRIEALISSWNDQSETSRINKNAGITAVPVSKELFQLIERSIKISKLTNGYFDISFASIDKVWNMQEYKKKELPSEEEIKNSVAQIDYKKIILNAENQTVFLSEKGMKIGFGAIGKGYAANKAKAIMIELGIESGVVNAGGDLISWGSKPGWRTLGL